MTRMIGDVEVTADAAADNAEDLGARIADKILDALGDVCTNAQQIEAMEMITMQLDAVTRAMIEETR